MQDLYPMQSSREQTRARLCIDNMRTKEKEEKEKRK
jgi:hypothetical protein